MKSRDLNSVIDILIAARLIGQFIEGIDKLKNILPPETII